jgi:glycosyltransferase involved in cell wall biosynthesis
MLVGSEPRVDGAENGSVTIRRCLTPVLGAWRRPHAAVRAVLDDEAVVRAALETQPDAALVWHMRGLTKAPLRLIHAAGIPVLYMLHDRWVLYERPGSLLLPWPRLDHLGGGAAREVMARLVPGKIELGAPPIERDGVVCFVSQWLADEHARRGWRPQDTQVIDYGVDLARLAGAGQQRVRSSSLRLLYAGRVEHSKGLDVAVQALAQAGGSARLTVAGQVTDPAYAARVMSDAQACGVADRITWLGEIPRAQVIELFAEHDVLVYPSRAAESYGLGLIEAMATGMVVVASAEGGPLEFLEPDVNSLVFTPGDADAMAGCLKRLMDDDLREVLVRGARVTADRRSLTATVDTVEALIAARLER